MAASLWTNPAWGAGEVYLGEVSEGDDKTLTVTFVDADGDPTIVDEVAWWVQTNPIGAFPTFLYLPSPVTPVAATVDLPMPPDVQAIVSNALDSEEHMIVVRARLDGLYKNWFLTYRVKNRLGMHVSGGMLVPEPTPTPE